MVILMRKYTAHAITLFMFTDKKFAKKNDLLETLRRSSYVMGAISSCLVIVGIAAVLVTAPNYSYPISVGGGCFFGFMVIL